MTDKPESGAYEPDALSDAEIENLGHERRQAARWFLEMGFSPEQSICLTLAGAPPAAVERALRADCTPETAFDIWT